MFSPSAGVFMTMGYTGTNSAGAFYVGGAQNSYNTYNINTLALFASGIDSPVIFNIIGTIQTTTSGNLYCGWGNSGAGGNSMTRYASSSISVVKTG
jgi:hypothetical protein